LGRGWGGVGAGSGRPNQSQRPKPRAEPAFRAHWRAIRRISRMYAPRVQLLGNSTPYPGLLGSATRIRIMGIANRTPSTEDAVFGRRLPASTRRSGCQSPSDDPANGPAEESCSHQANIREISSTRLRGRRHWPPAAGPTASYVPGGRAPLLPESRTRRLLAGSLAFSRRPCGPVLCAARREAIAAVNRLGAARAERNLGLTATARASCREHLAGAGRVAAPAAAATAVGGAAAEVTALGLTSCAARGAASRFAELAVRVELLLTRTEDEFLVAVLANQGLIRCVQRTLLARAA
jgi:hypothetical protein